MTFEQWKVALAIELERIFGWEPFQGSEYVRNCGDDGWREMFDDELTPAEAAREEADASADCVE